MAFRIQESEFRTGMMRSDYSLSKMFFKGASSDRGFTSKNSSLLLPAVAKDAVPLLPNKRLCIAQKKG
jgi:hypothetical protein